MRFTVVGLAVECTHEDISGIGPLWERFFKRLPEIENVQGIFGACFDKPGGFNYLCCARVPDVSPVPEGMVARKVPAAIYAVYGFHDQASEMSRVFTGIFDKHLAAAGLEYDASGAVLERYPDDCWDEATGKIKADLMIPVEN